jgi:hypothetical protein
MDIQLKSNTLTISPKSRGGEIFYPESDGEPIAETDFHENLLKELLEKQ